MNQHVADMKPTPTLDAVSPDLLPQVFPYIEDKLRSVAERSGGRWTLKNIVDDVMSRKITLLVVVDTEVRAVLATHLHQAPSGMIVLQIQFCTGENSKDWLHLLKMVEDYGRKNGAAKVEMWARKGWARKLEDYHLTHVLLEKDLG